jgi:hypothetical protein
MNNCRVWKGAKLNSISWNGKFNLRFHGLIRISLILVRALKFYDPLFSKLNRCKIREIPA